MKKFLPVYLIVFSRQACHEAVFGAGVRRKRGYSVADSRSRPKITYRVIHRSAETSLLGERIALAISLYV
jgi:hypothetical protein